MFTYVLLTICFLKLILISMFFKILKFYVSSLIATFFSTHCKVNMWALVQSVLGSQLYLQLLTLNPHYKSCPLTDWRKKWDVERLLKMRRLLPRTFFCRTIGNQRWRRLRSRCQADQWGCFTGSFPTLWSWVGVSWMWKVKQFVKIVFLFDEDHKFTASLLKILFVLEDF